MKLVLSERPTISTTITCIVFCDEGKMESKDMCWHVNCFLVVNIFESNLKKIKKRNVLENIPYSTLIMGSEVGALPTSGCLHVYHSGLNENILVKSKNIEKNILENNPDNSLKMGSEVGALSMGGACMFITPASMKMFQKNLEISKRIF